MTRLLDWPATLLLAVVFGLVLVVFEPIQWIAKAFGKRPHDWVVACLGTALVTTFRVTGLRISVDRSPLVKPRTPYLIISNHQSMFDIALLLHLLFTNFPKFVSKRELARLIPSVSYNLKQLAETGYCEQERSERDKRSRRIVLTKKGRDLCDKLADLEKRHATALFANCASREDPDVALRILRQLERSWSDYLRYQDA